MLGFHHHNVSHFDSLNTDGINQHSGIYQCVDTIISSSAFPYFLINLILLDELQTGFTDISRRVFFFKQFVRRKDPGRDCQIFVLQVYHIDWIPEQIRGRINQILQAFSGKQCIYQKMHANCNLLQFGQAVHHKIKKFCRRDIGSEISQIEFGCIISREINRISIAENSEFPGAVRQRKLAG